MSIVSGWTLETTYAVMLCHPDTPGENFTPDTGTEYTSHEDIRTWLRIAYGGWFADEDRHRIVRIERRVES